MTTVQPTAFCSNCGASITSSVKFCPECGVARIVEAPTETTASSESPDTLTAVVDALSVLGWAADERLADSVQLTSTRSSRHITLSLDADGNIEQTGDVKLDLSRFIPSNEPLTSSGPSGLRLRSARKPEEITSVAVRYFGSGGGWTVSTQTGNSATFAFTIGPACFTLGILLLLGIIPGVIYAVMGKTTVTASVSSESAPEGAVTYLTWSDFRCKLTCQDFGAMVVEQEKLIAYPLAASRTAKRPG